MGRRGKGEREREKRSARICTVPMARALAHNTILLSPSLTETVEKKAGSGITQSYCKKDPSACHGPMGKGNKEIFLGGHRNAPISSGFFGPKL